MCDECEGCSNKIQICSKYNKTIKDLNDQPLFCNDREEDCISKIKEAMSSLSDIHDVYVYETDMLIEVIKNLLKERV